MFLQEEIQKALYSPQHLPKTCSGDATENAANNGSFKALVTPSVCSTLKDKLVATRDSEPLVLRHGSKLLALTLGAKLDQAA